MLLFFNTFCNRLCKCSEQVYTKLTLTELINSLLSSPHTLTLQHVTQQVSHYQTAGLHVEIELPNTINSCHFNAITSVHI